MAGAGGVGKALAFALHELGAEQLAIYDKNPAAVHKLLAELPRRGMTARIVRGELADEMRGCRAHGIAVLSGFKLFLYQGLDAWAYFTGLTADPRWIESEFLRRYPLAQD